MGFFGGDKNGYLKQKLDKVVYRLYETPSIIIYG